jgi:hypothetical protein
MRSRVKCVLMPLRSCPSQKFCMRWVFWPSESDWGEETDFWNWQDYSKTFVIWKITKFESELNNNSMKISLPLTHSFFRMYAIRITVLICQRCGSKTLRDNVDHKIHCWFVEYYICFTPMISLFYCTWIQVYGFFPKPSSELFVSRKIRINAVWWLNKNGRSAFFFGCPSE